MGRVRGYGSLDPSQAFGAHVAHAGKRGLKQDFACATVEVMRVQAPGRQGIPAPRAPIVVFAPAIDARDLSVRMRRGPEALAAVTATNEAPRHAIRAVARQA